MSGHLDERLEAIADAIASDSDPIISLDVADVTALLGEVRALRTERDRIRDGIARKAAWWDRNGPAVPAFRAVDDFRALLDGEADA